ncbi:MAG: hypothetical protein ACR2HP_03285 [Ilumatobacteraceae bacterium]
MAPPKGHFVLHSNVLPPMTAGRYELVSDQTGLPFDVATEHTHVTVAAPRYSMPTEQILSSFPPANAEGAFGDRLPQIVLKRRTLPWERNPAGGGPGVSSTPWLALVVVAEGEAELSTTSPVAQCVTPGVTLPDPADRDVEQGLYLAVTETVVRKIFPCQQDLPLLVHVREVDVSDTELANGDDDGWLAVVLANRLPVFDQANGRSVRYLACLVNVEGQLAELPPPTPAVDFFEWLPAQDWSVLAQVQPGPDPLVMGGFSIGDAVLPAGGLLDAGPDGPGARLPPRALDGDAGATARTNVRSLDGGQSLAEPTIATHWSAPSATAAVVAAARDPDAKRLVRDTMGQGFRYPISIFALERVLRFPVLAHWSFTTSERNTFETLMEDLDVGLLGSVPEPDPAAPPAGPRPEVVATGHLGLGHRSRRGDATRAWYRGPFVAHPTEREVAVDGRFPVAHAADQLRRVVPDGREDVALAAAFEIGRLLGLSQLSVVSALSRFRAEQFGVGRVHSILGDLVDVALPELVGQLDLGRFVALTMLDTLSTNPDDLIGPRRPLVDPGREVLVRGDLADFIAGGLGLDVDRLRRTEAAVGIVAALAQTEVPVAAAPGGVELDEAALAGLQANLAAEVDRVVGVAVPTAVVIGDTAGRARPRRGARVAAGPDALDELLEAASRRDGVDEEDEP